MIEQDLINTLNAVINESNEESTIEKLKIVVNELSSWGIERSWSETWGCCDQDWS